LKTARLSLQPLHFSKWKGCYCQITNEEDRQILPMGSTNCGIQASGRKPADAAICNSIPAYSDCFDFSVSASRFTGSDWRYFSTQVSSAHEVELDPTCRGGGVEPPPDRTGSTAVAV
jgi:hypothetical protein